LETLLDRKAYNYFSPRLESKLSANPTIKERQNIFQKNLIAMKTASLVFARIDDYDPGTIWEMGYAFANKVDVVAWSLVEGRGLNLMLTESCVGFLNGWGQVKEFFSEDGIRREVAKQWRKEVE
jgi:nucleoside deoxyribosyltransferase